MSRYNSMISQLLPWCVGMRRSTLLIPFRLVSTTIGCYSLSALRPWKFDSTKCTHAFPFCEAFLVEYCSSNFWASSFRSFFLRHKQLPALRCASGVCLTDPKTHPDTDITCRVWWCHCEMAICVDVFYHMQSRDTIPEWKNNRGCGGRSMEYRYAW